MKFNLALVTGATSGIGEALCHLLASQGIDLIITGRDEAKLNNLKQMLPVQVISIAADLASERQRIIDAIHQYCPDLVINNAGIGLYGDALSHLISAQMEILKLNAEALLEITLEAAQTLSSKGKVGTILNVASAAAFQIFPSFAVYAASKAFVVSVSEALDLELEEKGIRVLTACPGMVKTEFSKRAGGTYQSLDDSLTMTPEYAAQQIWKQIRKGKRCVIFDWKTRIGTWIARMGILPKKWIATALRNRILDRVR